MADAIEKVFCLGDNSNRSAELMALMNNGGWNNNPFVWLVFMAMFGRNGMWGNDGCNAEVSRLSNQMSDNHNTDLLMSAIKGDTEAVGQLSTRLNCDFNSLNSAICGVRNGITELGGKVGISSERVINSVLLGNKDLTAALQNCCCQTQQNIIKMGYDNQIATMNQTTQLQERLTNIANGLQQGFSATAYETQRQTCDIVRNNDNNTQRIIDTLNGHWQSELQLKYQDAKAELSQSQQTNALTAQLTAIAAAIAKIPTT